MKINTTREYEDVDGNQVTAEDVFGINREKATVALIPYQDADTAAQMAWDYNARENSEYFQMLTGEKEDWELTVVQNQEQAQKFMGEEGFMTKEFQKDETDDWKTVNLPKSWTMQGFDFPIYTNNIMPWQSKYGEEYKDDYPAERQTVPPPYAPVVYNPVGLYRKTFEVKPEMVEDNRRIYLHFDGVESAYYVYVNGKEVGYSEDSFSPHRFDITDYLTDGENLLAVKVHKFSDSTWFEDQDMIYDGGIFRDVYMTSAPLVQMNDYKVLTDLDDTYENANLSVDIDVRNLSTEDQTGWSIDVQAFDEEGNDILGKSSIAVDEVVSGEPTTFSFEKVVENPKLWSAEAPNLYSLVMTLKDGNGKAVESLATQLGFREIEFTRTEVDENYNVITKEWEPIKINGERLLIKGANRHDTDPFNGKAVPQDVLKEDVTLMKKNNLNGIRTSHYSNDEYLYWLCNRYGLYMMGETNMECHGIFYQSDKQGLFYEMGMDRTETAYQRLKNYPAIVSWSIGNEMTYTNDPNWANGLQRDMKKQVQENSCPGDGRKSKFKKNSCPGTGRMNLLKRKIAQVGVLRGY